MFEIIFSDSGNAGKFLGDGWWSPEVNGLWAQGKESTLHLPPFDISGDVRIVIKLRSLSSNLYPTQRLSIAINEKLIANLNFFPVHSSIILYLPRSLIKKEGENTIVFGHPDCVSPKILHQAIDDNRDLSFFFRYFSLDVLPESFGKNVIPKMGNDPKSTLLFCTMHGNDQNAWLGRCRRWLDANKGSDLIVDNILIVDDGSRYIPEWDDVTVLSEDDPLPNTPDYLKQNPVILYHFKNNLGRSDVFDFPGWWRSWRFGVQFAENYGFKKVIHIESDAYLISEKIKRHFNDFSEGWTALWCPRHDFPELALQVAAGQGLAEMMRFAKTDYSEFVGKIHENIFPFTKVEKDFVGDRYGEYQLFIPINADYSAQTPDDLWWLNAIQVNLLKPA